MFQAKKGSKNTRLKGMDEFLQLKLKANQTEAVGQGEKPAEESHKDARKEQLRRVLDLSLLRLA